VETERMGEGSMNGRYHVYGMGKKGNHTILICREVEILREKKKKKN
jgi:hypothetical protein